jgi:hypothetical protein
VVLVALALPAEAALAALAPLVVACPPLAEEECPRLALVVVCLSPQIRASDVIYVVGQWLTHRVRDMLLVSLLLQEDPHRPLLSRRSPLCLPWVAVGHCTITAHRRPTS